MSSSFINDEVKMCDFFNMRRDDFLKFYTYLDEEEYENTIKEVLELVDYENKENVIEEGNLEYVDGDDLFREIVAPLMFMKVYGLKK